ncbi:MAG: LLM class F420-dependent oxidoreductase [Dehalococcoidia bacterium]|jgi:probable F420-dependent oxidoreductase|nr:LLM class F420-dependent oxidoreductase [Dehalococcoidia bacterium]
MKFGVFMFVTDYSIGPAELARAAEERGFEWLLFPEHTHIPTSRRTPWPGGGELPEEYRHTLDPFVAAAVAAAVTKELKVGTGVCLVPQHHPISLAKRVATLDLVSGGRFIFGVGAGWNEEEMEHHGVHPRHRWQVMRESILAMKAIWTQEEAEFQGRFVRFERIWSWPKPVQKPHPPIWVGGHGRQVLRRVVEWGDGWMPIISREERLGERIRELQSLAQEAGRGPIPVTAFGVSARPQVLEELARLGVERCIFWLRPGSAQEVLPYLDTCAELARQFAQA